MIKLTGDIQVRIDGSIGELFPVLCIIIHGAIGVTAEGIIEMLTIFMIVYGMLMVKEYTGNAWGCVFIFVFLWNAF
ncbi:hypothetical protein [Kineothrix sp. MB12-C1]|uniref:hypothetical protein n=1 Tax=Kineothrix sp. MB12-C1 TaxID=3070215 RepID=UPI0027D20CD9|nr:hypothetical protein [Kineothrix sp. MB12-C1]WMC91386.1 hypothetical protein RBB56_10915 [Kineothrix sp. MB12-C1]